MTRQAREAAWSANGLPPGPSAPPIVQTVAFHRDPLGVLRRVGGGPGPVFSLRLPGGGGGRGGLCWFLFGAVVRGGARGPPPRGGGAGVRARRRGAASRTADGVAAVGVRRRPPTALHRARADRGSVQARIAEPPRRRDGGPHRGARHALAAAPTVPVAAARADADR